MSVRCYIALGCNLGRRALQLRAAAAFLNRQPGLSVAASSGLYETDALLPPGAPASWDIPYLNQVIAVDTTLDPEAMLEVLKRCEKALGRQVREHWGPRELDCDLLMYGNVHMRSETLTLPHAQMHRRDFVLVPLADIAADEVIAGTGKRVGEWLAMLDTSRVRPYSPLRPRLMGIVNATPDSFSDGGIDAKARMAQLIREGADIIDIGGESTRPGARAISPDEEWSRIAPLMGVARERVVSVDTYHPQTARRALEAGAAWINDVSGARDAAMLEVVAAHEGMLVMMHSLGVPADPSQVMREADPVATIIAWAEENAERARRAGIAKLVLDPGIGFGKTAMQSFDLLMHMDSIIRAVPHVEWLVGHSRKSFMKLFSGQPAGGRDALTLAFSAVLVEDGVDYLRVHDVASHRALIDRWPL